MSRNQNELYWLKRKVFNVLAIYGTAVSRKLDLTGFSK